MSHPVLAKVWQRFFTVKVELIISDRQAASKGVTGSSGRHGQLVVFTTVQPGAGGVLRTHEVEAASAEALNAAKDPIVECRPRIQINKSRVCEAPLGLNRSRKVQREPLPAVIEHRPTFIKEQRDEILVRLLCGGIEYFLCSIIRLERFSFADAD